MNFIEELFALVGDEADKTKIEAGLKSYVESEMAKKMPELKKHADTVLTEKKGVQKEFGEFKDSVAWITENELDVEKYKTLMGELEQLRASSSTSSADIEAIKKEMFETGKKTKETEYAPKLKEALSEIELYKTKASENQNELIKYQTDIELNKVFNDLHIDDNPFTRQGIKAFAETEYNELDRQLSISMFDPSQNKHIPISDWVKTFPNTDAGKAIIKAPVNTGGGANGGDGSGNSNGESMQDIWDGMFPKTN